MIGKIFYFISSLFTLLGVFIFLSPSLMTPDLIYPTRIDSSYMAFHTETGENNADSLLLNPADLNLKYKDLKITTSDGFILNGWFISSEDTPANTIVIFHDLNESKILYIDHIKQFHDRGFNVGVFDLRAHGNSGGNEFTPGLPAIDDAVVMIDSIIAEKGSRHIVLMGVGMGAAIALQAAIYDTRCEGVILQSPFNSFENYLERYSRKKWGMMKNFWYPVLKRKTESLLQYPVKELDLTEITKFTSIPYLFIIGSDEEKVFTSEALQVFDASVTEKKELFLVKNTGKQNIAKAGGEYYYNRITAFLLASLPKDQKISRFKKLVYNDK